MVGVVDAAGQTGAAASVAAAYDDVAGRYDEAVAGDAWVRRLLWGRYLHYFRPGHRVLDVACGTGIDALFLARHGVRVSAIDVSPGMVSRLRERIIAAGTGRMVQADVLDIAHLSALPAGSFDGVISAFAGLNTQPDLRPFARDAAGLLRPGGVLIAHVLNRFSLWEWLGLMATWRWGAARRLARDRERAFVIGGHPVVHYLYAPRDSYAACFSPGFRLLRLYGVGAVCPPATLEGVPRWARRSLVRLDTLAGPHRPFSEWGRFFVLELERR